MHDYSAEVSVTTAAAILQPGYRIGDRVLRPARVSVLEPSGEAPVDETTADETTADETTADETAAAQASEQG
jgi:molecular chaperone GrpE